MGLIRGTGRFRSLLRFVFAVVYALVAKRMADGAALLYSFGTAYPLVRNLLLLLFLLAGFGYMGLAFDGMPHPLRAMGLARRPGWRREMALGIAFGWGLTAVVVLCLALTGALYVHFWWGTRAFVLLVVHLCVLAVTTLVDEVVFRGYPFQKLLSATGPFSATVLAGIFFGLMHMESSAGGAAGIWVSGVAAVLFSVAYLRTRALWLPWGLHFAWLATMGMLFGLPVKGNTWASTVVRTDTYGPLWLTGGGYGPQASWLMVLAMLGASYGLVRATRDLDWKYNQPEIRAAGIPVVIEMQPKQTPDAPKTQLVQIAASSIGPSEAQGAPAPPGAIQTTPSATLPSGVQAPADNSTPADHGPQT